MVGEGENPRDLLITFIKDFYIDENGRSVRHSDPTFGPPEWSFCTGNERLLKCGRGSYLFFHATKGKQRFITGYFVVKAVGLGTEIVPKYNVRGDAKHAMNIENHYVVVGDEKLSKTLKEPGLKFDRNLARKLTFDPPKKVKFDTVDKYGRNRSDLECISSATRSIRILSRRDAQILLEEISST